METETIVGLIPVEGAHVDLSPFTLFMQADWVVKSVMIGLLVASIICWAIIFSSL